MFTGTRQQISVRHAEAGVHSDYEWEDELMLSCFLSNIHKRIANISDLISFKPYFLILPPLSSSLG